MTSANRRLRIPGSALRAAPDDREASIRIDRKIAQPQIGKAALLPQTEERPVDGEPQRVVAALDRDADALAEVSALDERPAHERAAAAGIRAVEPEGEVERICEQEIDLAAPQRLARRVGGRIGAHLRLGEQVAQVLLVRGAGHYRDLLALDVLRAHVVELAAGTYGEASDRPVIGIAEAGPLARVGGDRDRGDGGVAAIVIERVDQRVEPAHLHRAGDVQFLADLAREIDVEADRIAIRSGV